MSKTVFVLFAVMIVCAVADPFDEIKTIVQRDQCGTDGLQTIRPKIENEIAILKQVLFPLFYRTQKIWKPKPDLSH